MKRAPIVSRLLLASGILGLAILVASNRHHLDIAVIEQTIRDLGAWAPAAHVILFAVGTVLFAPGSVFGLVGGVLFGPVWGTLLNLAGATLGATAAFLVARYVAADWVRARTGARLDRIISGVEVEGWRFVALMRLVPLVPFNLLNYALGLTRISLSHYVFASLIAMAPGTLAFTWLGHAGRGALDGDTSAIRYGLLALGLLAAIVFLPRLVQRLRRGKGPRWIEVAELRRLKQEGSPIAILDVRSASDFGGPLGHIPGARNVPLGEIEKRLDELHELAKFPIVLVCRAQTMSAKAAAILEAGDFQDVRVLKGGTLAWSAMQSTTNGAEGQPAREDCPGRSP
jgi:uncharacterized membrane protein YdjX (TVP38/TMEM64 family)/rhodanese-related sulfurtransferase